MARLKFVSPNIVIFSNIVASCVVIYRGTKNDIVQAYIPKAVKYYITRHNLLFFLPVV